MKPRAISNTLSFADNFFTPVIVVIPQFSNHEERLLEWICNQNSMVNQTKIINISNYTAINQNNENVGIEMVRELIATLAYGSYEGSERTISILHADAATIPAQNALLKLLEEPPRGTRVYLTVEDPEKLLETIISRCVVKRIGKNEEQGNSEMVALTSTIATASYRELIELAEKYKERDEAVMVIKELLVFLHSRVQEKPLEKKYQQQVQAVLKTLDGLQRNGNVRLLLEDCFFTVKGLK